jgi:four helix bundle protein
MVERFRDLRVYRDAFHARQIYDHSTDWPTVERYALTNQIRRSSRSVTANIAEAWRKRLYPKHFISKRSDADAEAAETRSWLDFALDHGYFSEDLYAELDDQYDKVQGSLVRMMDNPDRWCGPADEVREEQTDYFTSSSFPN